MCHYRDRYYFTEVIILLILYQITKWLRHFVILKPLLGLVFNSQKCSHTFGN
ncbi:hypothetical protein Pse7429DRAFT_4404 [Pseudanabaena biceps PCC 7429]|uniref:Uncharacterized protein n=1 Tax=Pseudanabaena biceps PCC 7429 TaxID=927668 RepID=L8MWV5_9CYAN|nr:hypothetical protein Pse7429DRAFT_4404 [Pseudanabaena biceps PCC 7429]